MNLHMGVDWAVFMEATRIFLHGGNPYTYGTGIYKVFEPFWTYILLAPFTLLPAYIGKVVVFFVGLACYGYTAIRMGAKHWQFALFLLSVPVIGSLYNGNIDWMVTLGLWMPPQVGLFFILMKPQIGAFVALYWLYISWKQGGWKQVVKVFAPVTAAYLLSFVLYGFWLKQMLIQVDGHQDGNFYFPYLIPFGLILLYVSFRDKSMRLSGISTQMVSPYVTMYNFSSSLLCLIERPMLFLAMWVTWWIPVLFSVFTQ